MNKYSHTFLIKLVDGSTLTGQSMGGMLKELAENKKLFYPIDSHCINVLNIIFLEEKKK